MEIKVTQEHIDNGKKCNSGECPIALALREKFPEALISASQVKILVCERESWLVHEISPPEVVDFISYFDVGIKAFPFTFTLEGIEE